MVASVSLSPACSMLSFHSITRRDVLCHRIIDESCFRCTKYCLFGVPCCSLQEAALLTSMCVSYTLYSVCQSDILVSFLGCWNNICDLDSG